MPVNPIIIGPPPTGVPGDTNAQASAKFNALLSQLAPLAVPNILNSKRIEIRDIQRGLSIPIQPTILSATPNTGYAGAGNTPILLQGTGFLTVTDVLFNGIAAKEFDAISDTQIWCMPQPTTFVGATQIIVQTANATGVAALSATTPFTFQTLGLAGTSSIFLYTTDLTAYNSFEGICIEPAGHLWVTSHRQSTSGPNPFVQNAIQILLPSQTIGLVVPISTGNQYHCTEPVAGPSGDIFTASHDGYAWKIPPNGDTAQKKKLPYANGEGSGLTNPARGLALFDGCVWMSGVTQGNTNFWYVWRVTESLDVTPFVFPSQNPKIIMTGTDNTLWFLDASVGPTVGFFKMSAGGILTRIGNFTIPSGTVIAFATIGPDGAIYAAVTDFSTAIHITRVDPVTIASQTLDLPTCTNLGGIMCGPDGNILVCGYAGSGGDVLVFKISTSLTLVQTITITNSGSDNLFVFGNSVGLDGAAYYALPGRATATAGFAKVT